MLTLTPEKLTKSQPTFSPAAQSLIDLVCDTLNTHTPQASGPVHEVMKMMLDIAKSAIHSPDMSYIDFVSFLFICVADEYLRNPVPSVSVARLLVDLTVEALAHCVHQRMPIPDCVRGMLPCVQDALDYGDEEHVARTHERFGLVVAGAVYGVPVWMEDV
jgi:hypothetical protein